MIYLLAIYIAGLAFMCINLACSPEHERAEAHLFGTLVAYLFWPISLIAVAAHVAWDRYRITHGGRSPLWAVIHH